MELCRHWHLILIKKKTIRNLKLGFKLGFSRKIEFYLLKELYKLAKNNNLNIISFNFINSGRNQYLINFLSNFGLKLNKNGNYKLKIDDIKKYG